MKHPVFSEDYRYEKVTVPEPGPGEILVKVEAVGICAGDAKTYAGATRFWGNTLLDVNYCQGTKNVKTLF